MMKFKGYCFLLFSLLTLFLTIYSCTKSDELSSIENVITEPLIELRSNIQNFNSFNLSFPDGTTFDFLESELRFTLPQPYFIIGVDDEGNYFRSTDGGSGGVTCICTEGSGCNPIKSGGDYGCLMVEGCNTCKKKNSSIVGVHDDLVEIAIFDPEYNLYVEDFSQLDGKRLLPSSLIDSEEITNLLVELEDNFLESEAVDTKIVFINAYGYILPIEIPSDIDNTSLYIISNEGVVGGEVCKCNIKGKKCPKNKKLVVVWCDSTDCNNCSLSGIIVNKEEETKLFSENNGLITLE